MVFPVFSWIFAALSSAPTWAQQQKHPITMSADGLKSRYVQQHIIDVDDMAGHQIRVLEIQRTYKPNKQPVVDGERSTEMWVRSFSNYAGGVGLPSGYTASADSLCP